MKIKTITHPSLAAVAAFGAPLVAFAGGVMLVVLMQAPAISPRVPAVSLDPELLQAKAAVLYDPATERIWYQKNADEQLPLASITKLMTAQVVLAAKSPATPVTITAEDLKPAGDWGFKPGQVIALGDLISFGLIVSSNDAMQAAASSLGGNAVAQMNAEAAAIGLTQTHFLNPTGLDVSQTVAGAYGSVYDVARMAAMFYKEHAQLFSETTQNSAVIQTAGSDLTAAATAADLKNVPGFIAGKTGYTDLAGGNLVVVFDVEPGHPLVAAVLGSTESGRFTDIRTLINAAYNAQ